MNTKEAIIYTDETRDIKCCGYLNAFLCWCSQRFWLKLHFEYFQQKNTKNFRRLSIRKTIQYVANNRTNTMKKSKLQITRMANISIINPNNIKLKSLNVSFF